MEKGQIKIAEQEEILNISDKNLIVSASAGSGKTTVMIRKIFNHILAKDCHIDELLVLTYTKSSALDMKKKLTNKIKDNLENNPFLQDELDLVQTSDISTFDSFCQKLVKKYFYLLDIDPSFSILDGQDQVYIQAKALKQALKDIKKEDITAYENLIENFSPKRDEATIESIILEIYNYLTSIYDEESFLENTIKLYNPELKIAENIVMGYYKNSFNIMKNDLEQLKILSNNFSFDKYVLYINEMLIILDRILSAKSFTLMLSNIQDISFSILRTIKSDEINFKDKILDLRNILSKQLDEIKKQYVKKEDIEKSYEKCQNLINNLIKLLFLFKKEYIKVKTELNTYDFNDIERLAIKLLQIDKINEEIKNSYKYIFVDEFQDANKVQEKIIFLLNNNNLFFVGDTKQSIYAFRQSDPEIFLNIEKNFNQDENSCAKTLNCNFRTNKNILHFVNQIFNVIMTENTCGINYKQNGQFVPKAEFKDVENEVCVSLNVLLPKEKVQDKLEVTKVYSVKDNSCIKNCENKFDSESLFVCNKIVELVGQKIYDNQTDTFREITYKDICILLLKRGKFLENLLKHLTEVGIPFTVNVNQNLEECYDNQVLYNLLKLVANNDDYALYMVLSSPLFHFSDYELAQIKETSVKEESFYLCLKNYQKNDNILLKINYFFENYDIFSYEVKYKGIFFGLDHIVRKTEYLLNISFDDDFIERKNNVINYVNSFAESKYNFNLSDYLVYRESCIRKEKVQNEKTFSQSIEITTMHSSKGLEYPIVILPFLNQDYTKEPVRSEIKINKDLGIGIKNYNDDDRTVSGGLFYNACKIKNKEIEISEKIRLLYVATTRAKNKLVLCGELNKPCKKFTNDSNIFQANNYLSLILGALPDELLGKIDEGQEFSSDLFDNEKIKLVVTKCKQSDITKEEIIMPNAKNEKNINLLAKFLKIDLSKQKSYIALKNSVSYLVADENSSLNYAPNTLSVKEHLSENANDKGTLYHKLLEKVEFKNINSCSDLQDFIECNFNSEEIEIFKQFKIESIYNNICILKSLIKLQDSVLKEQKFVMRVNYNEVNKSSDITDKILIQGTIDLVVIKQDQILLIDYKLTKKTDEQIKSTYFKQLELYSMALGKMFKNKPIKKLILNLKSENIIDLGV